MWLWWRHHRNQRSRRHHFWDDVNSVTPDWSCWRVFRYDFENWKYTGTISIFWNHTGTISKKFWNIKHWNHTGMISKNRNRSGIFSIVENIPVWFRFVQRLSAMVKSYRYISNILKVYWYDFDSSKISKICDISVVYVDAYKSVIFQRIFMKF